MGRMGLSAHLLYLGTLLVSLGGGAIKWNAQLWGYDWLSLPGGKGITKLLVPMCSPQDCHSMVKAPSRWTWASVGIRQVVRCQICPHAAPVLPNKVVTIFFHEIGKAMGTQLTYTTRIYTILLYIFFTKPVFSTINHLY